MSLWQALILGVVQGATEFIPVSSSGHLALVPWLLGWQDPGLVFYSTLHLGTVLAVLLYFRRDIVDLLHSWWQSIRERRIDTPETRLPWLIILGTIPAAVLGFLLQDYFEALFGAPAWIGFFLLVTAGILALGEWLSKRTRGLRDLKWGDALAIGLAQVISIAPGLSRSGTTIAAGLGRGIERGDSARFSFLLAIPIVVGTGLFELKDLLTGGPSEVPVLYLAAGFLVAAIIGYLCIAFLLAYLRRQRLYPFAIYCGLAGVLTLVISWLR